MPKYRLPRKLKKRLRKERDKQVLVEAENLAEKLIFGHIVESMEKIRLSGEWTKFIGKIGPSMDEAIEIKRRLDRETKAS